MACEDVILLAAFPSHLWPRHLEASREDPMERFCICLVIISCLVLLLLYSWCLSSCCCTWSHAGISALHREISVSVAAGQELWNHMLGSGACGALMHRPHLATKCPLLLPKRMGKARRKSVTDGNKDREIRSVTFRNKPGSTWGKSV